LIELVEEYFLMQEEIMPKGYEPNDVERRWYKYWEDNNLFRAEHKSEKRPVATRHRPCRYCHTECG
jgi:leucyl-tRNA synthetase